MFKSSNPLLSRMDNNVQMLEGAPMTVSGTITKTFILLLIAAVSAAAVVYEAFMGYTDKVMMIMKIALFAGLGTGLATAFVPKLAKFSCSCIRICARCTACSTFTYYGNTIPRHCNASSSSNIFYFLYYACALQNRRYKSN